MRPLLPIFCLLSMSAAAWGDVVHMKNGSKVEGEVRRADDAWIITGADGKVTQVDAADVATIEMGRREEAGADLAAVRLASLKRSVASIDDAGEIVRRYERFIEQHPGTSAATAAREELAVWKQRQEQGLVKYGADWVTPQQREAMEERSFLVAQQARDLLAQGNFREAETLIDKALADDPTNPAAMYMRGVLQFGREQIPEARKTFDALNAAMPNYAPVLNNLGVILWRQNQHVAALNFYEQAMQVAPMNVLIVDNLAEAIAALPAKYANNATVRKVVDRFKAQDALLQQRMAESGWYRWGATWLDKAQFERLQEAERDVRKQLAALADDFNQLRSEIDEIDKNIEENKRAMRQLEASRYYRDRDGNLIKRPLPPLYDQFREDNEHLMEQREQASRKANELRAEGKRIEGQLPQPTFTGSQRLIGVEGAPLAPAAATQPATQSVTESLQEATTQKATTQPSRPVE